MPYATFIEQANHLDGKPSLSKYLEKQAQTGSIGPTNANRIIALGIDGLVTRQTVELLTDIMLGDGPVQHMDIIAPAVRVIDDFEIGDKLRYHDTEIGSRWTSQDVWATEYGPFEPDEESNPLAGIVTQDHKFLRTLIDPRWPALVQADFYERLMGRRNAIDHSHLTKAGRFFFELSFFTNEIDDEVFRNVARNALRHFGLTVPTKIHQ